jgi:hypothetical protein
VISRDEIGRECIGEGKGSRESGYSLLSFSQSVDGKVLAVKLKMENVTLFEKQECRL